MYSVVAAVVAFFIAVLTVHFGNKIKNRLARYAALIVGIAVALGACGLIAGDPQDGSDAGQIFAGLVIVAAVLSSIYKRFKKPAPKSDA